MNASKSLALFFAFGLLAGSSPAAELHVNCHSGNDANSGAADKPLRTLQRGISLAKERDVIHLHPRGATYRQSGTFRQQVGITIEGNGVTLDGADPLPEDGWEQVAANLYRRQMKRTPLDRHLLIRAGVMERMGRTQSANSPDFPPHSELKPGQFCFENIDDKTGWLYVCGSLNNLEWSTRVNGVATGGECRALVVRNLNTRNFLNDGFNVHGDCRELKFENVNGYNCFDEGFSAHESAECEIDGGKFYGNENGIADVNTTITVYRNCQFYDNVNTDVLLVGKSHRLIDCQIVNMTSAVALNAGLRDKQQNFALELERVSLKTDQKTAPGHARVNGGTLLLKDCVIENVRLNTLGADVSYQGQNQIDGKTVAGP
ncbi:right-handed parallel beta-helix repeat-containing protein [Blastopirellula marina]|nr:right-handed parallel beta-helix repeat-containing protein [Blastopirellula marina]